MEKVKSTIDNYSKWVVFLNMLRRYKTGTFLDIKDMACDYDFDMSYANLMNFKHILVTFGYVSSLDTYIIKLENKIPFGLTSGGKIGRTKIDVDRGFRDRNLLGECKYTPKELKKIISVGRTDSDVFPEKNINMKKIAEEDMESDADIQSPSLREASSIVKKALKTNERQIPKSVDRSYKEQLGHREEMRVELGITLRCKNVKKNVNGGITDFDFSGAEISISRLVIDENKYNK